MVCVLGRDGRAAGLDRYTGRALWHFALPAEGVTAARIDHDLLVITGILSPDSDAQSAVVAAVDLATGRPRFPTREDPQDNLPLRWVAANPDGDLLALSDRQLTLHSRDDGRPIWRVELPDLDGQPTAVPAGGTLFLVAGKLLGLNPLTGNLLNRNPQLTNVHEQPTQWLGHADQLFAVSPAGLKVYHANGGGLWRDGITLKRQHVLKQPRLSQRHLAVVSGIDNVAQRTPPSLPSLYLLEQDTGRLVADERLNGLNAASKTLDLRVYREHLLVTDGKHSLLIPAAGDP